MAFTNARDLTSILQLNDLALTESNHAEVVKKIMDTGPQNCAAPMAVCFITLMTKNFSA